MEHLVIDASTASPYLFTAFPDGNTPVELLFRRLKDTYAETSATVVVPAGKESLIPPLPAQWSVLIVAEPAAAFELFSTLHESLSTEIETLVWTSADAPFVDLSLSAYLHALHQITWCDYTFADGFPQGYAPEILRRSILPVLRDLAGSATVAWNRSVLFDTVSRDINAFDIETEAAAEDFALLRLSLTVDTRQNYLLCRRLYERLGSQVFPPSVSVRPEEERYPHRDLPLLATLLTQGDLRRTLPYYYQVQITTEAPQRPQYTVAASEGRAPARPGTGEHLSVERWEQLLAMISHSTPEAIVAPGYLGDPICHPEFPAFIRSVEAYPGLRLYIESSGVCWREEHFSAVQSAAVAAVIIEIDSVDPEQYRKLRGEGFEEAISTVERLRNTIPHRVYAQGTRMVDNEWELQPFFQHWDSRDGVTPLIQKYNSVAGILPDRRVVDLSPLRRIPCWHLQRDLVVRIDGAVPRCFQDLDLEAPRGNVFHDGLEAVWNAGGQEFSQHLQEQLPAMCERCDEYYTFNA